MWEYKQRSRSRSNENGIIIGAVVGSISTIAIATATIVMIRKRKSVNKLSSDGQIEMTAIKKLDTAIVPELVVSSKLGEGKFGEGETESSMLTFSLHSFNWETDSCSKEIERYFRQNRVRKGIKCSLVAFHIRYLVVAKLESILIS